MTIAYMELPNGRLITVCALHKQIVCGQCCLDFSFVAQLAAEDEQTELERLHGESRELHDDNGYSDEDDDELFGYNFNSIVPRDVSLEQVANSKFGRRRDPEIKSDDGNTLLTTAFVGWHEDAEPRTARAVPTGNVIPARFGLRHKTPLSPQELFPRGRASRACPPVERFINRYDTSEFLIYTDGACFNNGAAHARGGCSFVFRPARSRDEDGGVAFRLEERGPDGRAHRHTSNRAELRAVIAALQYRPWSREGFSALVVATDSTYVVNGATIWARAWMRKGWRLRTGEPVKNRDLWEALLVDVERLHAEGLVVRFWKIPRRWNVDADRAAKGAAAVLGATDNFTDHFGIISR